MSGTVDPQQLATAREAYQRDGFVRISSLFNTAELDELEQAYDAVVTAHLAGQDEIDHTWPGDWMTNPSATTKLVGIHDVQAYSAVWARALLTPNLTSAFVALIGSPDVQLHHTKLFLKPPHNGSAFPMHQDYPWFPHAKHSVMAGIIHLSDATAEMGCLRVIPGSHRRGPLQVAEDSAYYLPPEDYPISEAEAITAQRGDVIFFNYLTIHGSEGNHSDRPRKTVLVQVRAAGDHPTLARHHTSHAHGLMLAGMNPHTNWKTHEGRMEDGAYQALLRAQKDATAARVGLPREQIAIGEEES